MSNPTFLLPVVFTNRDDNENRTNILEIVSLDRTISELSKIHFEEG